MATLCHPLLVHQPCSVMPGLSRTRGCAVSAEGQDKGGSASGDAEGGGASARRPALPWSALQAAPGDTLTMDLSNGCHGGHW